MDKEVQDRLIEKCKTIVESEYRLEVPIRMADIHDSMIRQGVHTVILVENSSISLRKKQNSARPANTMVRFAVERVVLRLWRKE